MLHRLTAISTLLLRVVAACPGSPASVHAKCSMTVSFQETCDVVKEEIKSRLAAKGGWSDPHNSGTYKLQSEYGNLLEGSRLTGNGKYTDLFDLAFFDSDEGGCLVPACSESQVSSILDMSTNYCNLHNLYCNSDDGCSVIKSDLRYEESFRSCWQRKKELCISEKSSY
jgi:hypothetical protein